MSDHLCRNLKLTITRAEAGAQIQLKLRDDLNLKEVEICYPVTQREDGSQRRYHLREAMVIAIRRLVGQAIEAGLISDSPGVLTNLKSGITGPPDPSITFTIGADSS
jgi:hypothetical protein